MPFTTVYDVRRIPHHKPQFSRRIILYAENKFSQQITEMYIHELKKWPEFTWKSEALINPLGEVRHLQWRILGLMGLAGF